jgi:hypothetical protein
MNLRLPLTASTLALALAATSSQTHALGYGLFVEGSMGSDTLGGATVEVDYKNGSTEEYDAKTQHFSMGFTIDTGVRERFFNYRFSLGMDNIRYKSDDKEAELSMTGVVTVHDFGFQIRNSEKSRLWAGPEVRLGTYQGGLGSDTDADIELTGFGVGAVLGYNRFMSDTSTLSLRAGIINQAYFGNGHDIGNLGGGDVYVDEINFSLTAALLFE